MHWFDCLFLGGHTTFEYIFSTNIEKQQPIKTLYLVYTMFWLEDIVLKRIYYWEASTKLVLKIFYHC